MKFCTHLNKKLNKAKTVAEVKKKETEMLQLEKIQDEKIIREMGRYIHTYIRIYSYTHSKKLTMSFQGGENAPYNNSLEETPYYL